MSTQITDKTIEQNFFGLSRAWGAGDKFPWVEYPGCTKISWDSTSQLLNYIFLDSDEPMLSEDAKAGIAAAIKSYQDQSDRPFLLFYRAPEVREEWQAFIASFGIETMGQFALVSCELENLTPPEVNITVAPVTNEHMLEQWCDIQAQTFGVAYDEVLRVSKAIDGLYEAHCPIQLYLGLKDDVPVTATLAFSKDNIVGFYWGATLSEHRRHGYYEQLRTAVMWSHRQAGCHTAVAQTGPGSTELVQKLGGVIHGYFHSFGWSA